MHPDPGRRPSAAGLRDLLLAAIAAPAVAAAPGWGPEAAPVTRRHWAMPDALRVRARPAATAVLVGWAAAWTLSAFPMYPPSWTIPIAAILAVLAWGRPRAAAIAGAVLVVPAFWNFAQAAGLAWIGLAAVWTWASARTSGGRDRCLAPLAAGPLALIGLGPAYVLIAATAPTRGRRAVEAAAGAVVAAVCGGWAGPRLSHALAGTDSPLAYVRLIDRTPAMVATGLAMALFAVLLAEAWRAERQLQALALWGLAFGLAIVGIPQLLSSGAAGLGVGVAALLTAIIPAVWAVAGPDLERDR
jgi:hypothetical protein